MKHNKNEPFKLKIGLELAYEIIFYSLLIIVIGLAYIFASNLLTFNWYTIVFGVVAIFLLFLKQNNFAVIEDGVLTVHYLKFIEYKKIEMKTIDEFIFYEQGRRVEARSNKQTILVLHLKQKNKKILMDWLVQNYPNIPCYFLNESEING